MTLKKYNSPVEIEKGKPYSQQLGRKTGKGRGHISSHQVLQKCT